ncbi:lipopolysaccharide biosynthesis protein [Mucilaginibacter sp. SP1R1]|uniref:lipopolysaccharide biosynthesis protein n=1 Tax=Mucilaginibacter sp. SP1R1 TaxID=2723091 RepID=UPI001612080D|nr:lipopolysaccharide biosynthesis protein [Mucilaginibacter sp. SP1R1]MBB6149552.1 hypothetical protein [Mucilaginibacter sp. SP1R1]
MDNKIENDEISVKEVMQKLGGVVRYIKTQWKVISVFILIGASIGLLVAFFTKPTYTAVCTFVLEDGSKAGGLGQYAGLASLAGIDIGGGGGSGIFQGDNIIELYKSRLMIEKTLLSEVTIDKKKQLLIDRYIDFNKLRSKWKEKDHIDKISFNNDPNHFERKQDSIISNIVEIFDKKVLSVGKPDKKLSIIRVEVVSEDELFAREFNLKLVETVNNFYTQTKTKKSNQNVTILQRQADSVKRVLNFSIDGVASSIDAAPNANPLLLTLKAPSQKRQIDVQASTAIYAEIVKNLELSKISLRQELPLIQVIDAPVLPLAKEKVGKLKGIVIGGILSGFLCLIFVVCKRLFKSLMS